MKIYTKTGDYGTTSFGNTRVDKNDACIEILGSIDELNSYLGLIKSFSIVGDERIFIKEQQVILMKIMANMHSSERERFSTKPLERAIDSMDIEELDGFVIPEGFERSQIHICRTICRKVERMLVDYSRKNIHYFNRLSDYLFALSIKKEKL